MVRGPLDTLTAALDVLADVDVEALDDSELHAVVVGLGTLSTRLEAQWCRLIARWDSRPGVGRRRLQGGRRPLGPRDALASR